MHGEQYSMSAPTDSHELVQTNPKRRNTYRASEIIYGLHPVSFRYKPEIEPTRPVSFGLIAEDVEEISPDLVTPSGNGKPNSVRYDAINAMLLNEFLKEHKAFVEQKQRVQELEATVANLVIKVNEQALQIQKAKMGVDASRPASQMAAFIP
jgi:hypothetical protein